MSDLISRSTLLEAMENLRKDNRHSDAKSRAQHNSEITACIKRVVEQPTIEAVPVVYGEWKNMAEHNDHLHCKCSICGFTTENYQAIKNWGISSDDYLEYKWNFCPKCGTRMRKKV